MSEVLQNILREVSIAKTLPDADLQFLVELETKILTKLRAPLEAAAGQMGAGPSPSGGSGMDPAMAGGMAPGMGAPPMGPPPGPMDGPPGLRAQPPMPSPDEMQRLMAGSA